MALSCAESGAKVRLGGDGSTDEYSVFAATIGKGIDQAEHGPLLAVTKKFAARLGGEIEVESSDTARELRLTCRFSPLQPPKPLTDRRGNREPPSMAG